MIYAALMTAGILEFIFALLLALEFFDMEAEKEAAYQDGFEYGVKIGKYIALDNNATAILMDDNEYYDSLVDEVHCWFGMDGDA